MLVQSLYHPERGSGYAKNCLPQLAVALTSTKLLSLLKLQQPTLKTSLPTKPNGSLLSPRICGEPQPLWLSDHQMRCLFAWNPTGKYWIPVYNILEPFLQNYPGTSQNMFESIRGKKTDKKDSIWIADLPQAWTLFPAVSFLRQIFGKSAIYSLPLKIISFVSSEKNRVQNSLTVSNIMLSSVVSDTFGKSSLAILAHLLKNPSDQDFDFLPLLHGAVQERRMKLLWLLMGPSARSRLGKSPFVCPIWMMLMTILRKLSKPLSSWRPRIPLHKDYSVCSWH